MEKRTPNDADDAGPLGRFLGCLCPPGKHERGLARLAQATPYIMCMFHGFGPLAHISNTFVAPKLVQCRKCGC